MAEDCFLHLPYTVTSSQFISDTGAKSDNTHRSSFLILYNLDIFGSKYVDTFGVYGNSTEKVSRWVDDLSPLVSPAMCHSHNDYLRPHPLFSALSVGCASVEADVWLSRDGKDLYVAHHQWDISTTKTLRSLYVDPLLQILDATNSDSSGQAAGVFLTQPNMTLILFIDVKDDPSKTWPVVLEHLEPLRERGLLSRHEKMPSEITNQTFWPGSITVVGTGNILGRRDVNMGPNPEQWQQYHDVFLDAPLDQLMQPEFRLEENENEFYTASVSLWRALGLVLLGFSKSQISKLREQIRIAKRMNLLSRYWELPHWPISRRNYVWEVLVEEGIDLLNADDIGSAVSMHWNSDYLRDVVWVCGITAFLFSFSLTVTWLWKRRKAPRVGLD